MKWVMRGILAILLLVVVAIGAAFAMLATFDPNDYKDIISAAVKESTGRELVIAGDIKASLFPVLGFEVSDLTLGNPKGFSQKDFLSVSSAQAGVEIMPLFERRIELTKVILNKPSINIVKSSSGANNLTFSNGSKAEVKAKGDAPAMDLNVGSIEINNAKVTYTDQGTGKTILIDPLNVTLPGYTPGKTTDVAINMVLKTNGSSMAVDSAAKAKAAPQDGTLELSNIKASVTMTAPTLADSVKVHMTGSGNINAKSQDIALNIPDMKVSWAGTDITGETKINGKFSAPVASFVATSSKVDLDSLLSGIKKNGKAEPGKQLLPVEMLQTLNMDGDISITELVFSGLSINNVKAKIGAKNGMINLAPITADIYEGQANAGVTINAQNDTPVFALKNNVTGVEMGKVLKAKMGQDYITGKANVSYNITATGNSVQALQSSAAGTARFDFGEGYINKWQLSRLLNQAIAFFEKGEADEAATDRIYFTALNGTFNGQNGVFRNNDTVMTGPKIHALGSGVVNFATQTVDYRVKVGLGTEADPNASHLPISISGPLSKPSYGLDTASLVRNKVKEKLQDKLMEKLGGGEGAAAEGDAGVEGTEGSSGKQTNPEAEAAKQLLNGLFGGQ